MRFEQGDAFPPYSSFRADPQGTKALYESLQGLPNITVSRNFKSWQRLTRTQDTTVLLLGLRHTAVEYIGGREDHSLLDYIAAGNRLIVATVADSGSMVDDEREEDIDAIDEEEVWRSHELEVDFDSSSTLGTEALAYTHLGLPNTIPWRASRRLVDYDDTWNIIYQVDDSPVIMERRYGRGSVVLLTDSYLFSNEALLKERQPELIAWLLHNPSHIMFNESHLGVVEPQGIATLIREYQLSWFALSLGFVALLLIWKSSQSLIPPKAAYSAPAATRQAQRNLQSGYRNLLVRCIPYQELLSTCVHEWRMSHTEKQRAHPDMQKTIQAIEQTLQEPLTKAERKNQAVILYRKIQAILKRNRNIKH